MTDDPATDDPAIDHPAIDHPASSPPAATRPRRSGPPWSVVWLSLALALLGLAVGAAGLLTRTDGGGDQAASSVEQSRAQALQAARDRTVALTTYAHTTLDADIARVLGTATGSFQKDYTKTVTQLRPTFTSTQAVATGNVRAAGLESFTDAKAVAVVAVDQVIRTKGAAPRTERNRLRMTLVRPGDTWLVERVERL